MKRIFYRVKTPHCFPDLNSPTLEGAKNRLANYGTTDENSEYFEEAEEIRAGCVIVKVTEIEEKI